MINTAILTTVHRRGDMRIRVKEAPSLIEAFGGPVTLFVQDAEGDEDRGDGFEVFDTGPGKVQGRLTRMTRGAWRMYRAVRTARPAVAHFHDPELIPAGLALKLSGIKVIYDVHEDVPRQILGKFWLSPSLRRPAAWVAEAFEWFGGHFFDGIVAATPTIARRFPASKTVTVQNFPILSELAAPEGVPYSERPPHFAYVGSITGIRGSREMVQAVGCLSDDSVCLHLAGKFQSERHGDEVRALDGWMRVKFYGWASRPEVSRLLGCVRAGLVLFHPAPNHMYAQPNKMFEYMAVGLPVIASDFPLWREIVDGVGCGRLVDPLDPEAIAEAMQWLLDHPAEAEAMGGRGRQAVKEIYNWESEAEKLVELYRRLLSDELVEREPGNRYGDG